MLAHMARILVSLLPTFLSVLKALSLSFLSPSLVVEKNHYQTQFNIPIL
jgi:hypothetical protein